ncbi:MAG: uroporphyrinogen decarboxylase family protein [Anaerolineae bacterium]|nr:uroporphyrinogen decarboxylase family protein [Anaerolineae bacterium]MDW8071286.1 uroporphyrinogen decarboxylase family protein [Anaerolineae bacterium]
MERTANCLAKLERMNKALHHQEGDRVPISDFFWTNFLRRWREELGLPADASPYYYYDLDWIVTVPNMDPHIKDFEVLEETEDSIIVRTGFEAIIQRKSTYPMPRFLKFETDTIEKMRAFQFDDPWDERRYFKGGDNQLAGVGDTLTRNLPPWIETVKSLYPDFPVYGSVCEGHEMTWRILGQENVLLWSAEYPDELARFVERVHQFNLGIAEAQIKAADGLLDGMVIWGDVAYTKDLFFPPDYWRRVFKPGLKALVDLCHSYGLPVIYHGCGNVRRIFEDFIEVGVDAYNPLEAKAGLDVVELRRQYGHRIAFCGNISVVEWAQFGPEQLKAMVLRKLNAAKGGGYIVQSDHSVPDNISPQNYEYVVNLVREYGRYPLQLGEYDLPDVH